MLNVKKHRQTKDPIQTKSQLSLPAISHKTEKTLKDRGIAVPKKESGLVGVPEPPDNPYGGPSLTAKLKKGIGVLEKASSPFTGMNSDTNATSLALRDSGTDALLKSGNPITMAIGAAAKVLDSIGDATDLHVSDINENAAKKAGVEGGERFLNNAISAIPGMGTISAMFSGKTNEAQDMDDYGKDISASYGGAVSDAEAASNVSGIRTAFGIGKGKINKFIDDTNQRTKIVNDIGYVNSLAKKSNYGTDLAQQSLNRYVGTNYQMHAVGKKGMKIISRSELQHVLALRKLQKGGVIGTDVNLIPEGSLHARLNHLQDANPDLEDTTRKGIPVLDANGEQVAEIECNELCLTKSLTEKIEELMKDGSDEAMIEAGRLLATELIENTQDNVGLLEQEENNGK